MLNKVRSFFSRSNPIEDIATLLAKQGNRESLLGIKEVALPHPDQIRKDAAKLARYSESSDYKVFAEEVWGRVLTHLDVVLDDKSNAEKKSYHCGALKATLDLLRLSYQARSLLESMDKHNDASLRQ